MVSPRFLLVADIPESVRACARFGRGAVFTQIAFGRVADPLRTRAMEAFDEFLFGRARDVYPRYNFARMNDDEFGATLGID